MCAGRAGLEERVRVAGMDAAPLACCGPHVTSLHPPAPDAQAYEGNRAPVPIYMHMPWMTQEQNKE